MSEPKPTPLELATLAALIATQDPDEKHKRVESYFDEASALIKAASAYQFKKEFPMTHLKGLQKFSFYEVLNEQSSPEKGRKKGPTMVGVITTRAGLRKAIYRDFEKAEAARIIENGYLLMNQIKRIVDEQRRRNASRTEKANQAKSRSQKKRARKSVN